jgi:hypothetical protein
MNQKIKKSAVTPINILLNKLLTVVLILYSEEAIVDDAAPEQSLDNNDRRSPESESTFTDAESPKRTCNWDKLKIIYITEPRIMLDIIQFI